MRGVSEAGVHPATCQPGISLEGAFPAGVPDPSNFQRMNKLHRSESTVGFPLLICFFLFIFHVLLSLWLFFLLFFLCFSFCSYSLVSTPGLQPHSPALSVIVRILGSLGVTLRSLSLM